MDGKKPETFLSRSPKAMTADSCGGPINQWKIDLGEKTARTLLIVSIVAAVSIAINLICCYQIHWYAIEQRLAQDAVVHLQSDYIAPLTAKVDGLEHEVQALTIRLEIKQELKK
jgi:hypothetical protein